MWIIIWINTIPIIMIVVMPLVVVSWGLIILFSLLYEDVHDKLLAVMRALLKHDVSDVALVSLW